jgi:hypothetical protein
MRQGKKCTLTCVKAGVVFMRIQSFPGRVGGYITLMKKMAFEVKSSFENVLSCGPASN